MFTAVWGLGPERAPRTEFETGPLEWWKPEVEEGAKVWERVYLVGEYGVSVEKGSGLLLLFLLLFAGVGFCLLLLMFVFAMAPLPLTLTLAYGFFTCREGGALLCCL